MAQQGAMTLEDQQAAATDGAAAVEKAKPGPTMYVILASGDGKSWTLVGAQEGQSRAAALSRYYADHDGDLDLDDVYQAVPAASWKALRLKPRPPVAVVEA